MKITKALPPDLKLFVDSLTDKLITPEMLDMFSVWLEPIKKQLPKNMTQEDSDAFSDAIFQEALKRFNLFLKGATTYQNNDALRYEAKDTKIIWQNGNTKLIDYNPNSNGDIILVIPSLVNRFDILDIDKTHSFLRYLSLNDFRPLVIDWESPSDEEKTFSMSDYMTKRLDPIFDFIKENSPNKKCHILGYCMGGLLSLALALKYEKHIKSLTLFATPWDFHEKGIAGVPSYKTWAGQNFVKQAEFTQKYIKEIGYLPSSFLQAIFTTYQPLQILQKYMGIGLKSSQENDISRFILTEDWLNNGVALSVDVANECLHDWFKENKTGKLKWEIAGNIVDPRELSLPTYLLIPKKDNIVPQESALPLKDLINKVTLHQPDMGHIGVMVSDKAKENVWKPFVDWLKA